MPTITLLYAGILGLLSIGLSAPAGILRGKKSIDAGDGGDPELMCAMRRHANFVEYVPLALMLVGFLELSGGRPMGIHGLGMLLVAGRFLHAAFFNDGVKSFPRGIGAGLSVLTIVIASVWAIATFMSVK